MNGSLTASATISKLTSIRPGVVSLFEGDAICSAASGVVSKGKNIASVEL